MISKENISKLCKLSRLEFEDHEFDKLVSDIENIMKFTNQVSNHEFANTFDNSYDTTHNHDRNNIHVNYEKCSHDQIMSGGTNKNGFFFVKHFSK